MSADFEARIISLLWFQISPLRTESSDDPTDDQQAIPQPLAALSWLNDESAWSNKRIRYLCLSSKPAVKKNDMLRECITSVSALVVSASSIIQNWFLKMLLIPSTSYFPSAHLRPFCQSASLISAPKIPLEHHLKQRQFLMRDAKLDHLPVDITCPEVTISLCIYFLRMICFPEIQRTHTNLHNYYRSIKP